MKNLQQINPIDKTRIIPFNRNRNIAIKISKNEMTIIKKDYRLDTKYKQALVENLIYKIHGQLDSLPLKISFQKTKEEDPVFESYFLEKEYLYEKRGSEIDTCKQAPQREKDKIISLINFFYEQEYFWLDLKDDNFILTPDEKLYLIDFGSIGYHQPRPFKIKIEPDLLFLREQLGYEPDRSLFKKINDYNYERTQEGIHHLENSLIKKYLQNQELDSIQEEILERTFSSSVFKS